MKPQSLIAQDENHGYIAQQPIPNPPEGNSREPEALPNTRTPVPETFSRDAGISPPPQSQNQTPLSAPPAASDLLVLFFLVVTILVGLSNFVYNFFIFKNTIKPIQNKLKNISDQGQMNNTKIDSIITEMKDIKNSLKQVTLTLSNSPKTIPSYQESVYPQQQVYSQQIDLSYVDRLLSDYNNDNLGGKYSSIAVAETPDSRTSRDNGLSSTITFQQDTGGAFLVFQDEDNRDNYWLLPDPGYKNESRLSRKAGLLGLVEKVFVIQGNRASYNTFKIIRPGLVRSIGNGIYELIERGEIQFR